MKYIVTGSTGFVGQKIVQALLKMGKQVISLTTNHNINEKILTSIQGSQVILINSLNKINKSLLDGSTVIHCAWSNVQDIMHPSHYDHALEQIDFLYLIAESKAKKLVITGTCYEFGAKIGPMSILSKTAPNTPYAKAKDIVHREALDIILKNTDIDFTWARLFYIFGEGQHEKSLYAQLMKAINDEKEFFNMSLGEQLYDYLEVSDVANFLCHVAVNKSPPLVHICSGYPISVRELVQKIITSNNSKLKLNLGYYPSRKHDSIELWGAESFFSQMKNFRSINV